MRSIAQFCYRRRRYVVVGWILLLVGVLAISTAFSGEFSTEFKLPGSESQDALDLLEESGVNERTGVQGQVVFEAEQGVQDPAVRESVEGLLADIRSSVPEVETVSPYEPGKDYQIADNGRIAYAELNFSDRNWEAYLDDADVIKDLRDDVNVQGLRIEHLSTLEPSLEEVFLHIISRGVTPAAEKIHA